MFRESLIILVLSFDNNFTMKISFGERSYQKVNVPHPIILKHTYFYFKFPNLM